MRIFGNYFCLAVCASLVFEYGCTIKNLDPKQGTAAFASPSQLTATLTNDNIVLHWKNNATAEGGNWVEFATPGSEYIKLGVFTSETNVTSFIHPRVAPRTTFIYHIQPFFGRATTPAGIITGLPTTNALALDEGPIASTNEISSGRNLSKVSLRTMRTFPTAAPMDLTATLSSPNSVDLHWKDCASDEDGYFIEIKTSPAGKFEACAMLPPDATSFRKTGLSSKTKYYFRVRAYFNGKPSEVASVMTPSR